MNNNKKDIYRKVMQEIKDENEKTKKEIKNLTFYTSINIMISTLSGATLYNHIRFEKGNKYFTALVVTSNIFTYITMKKEKIKFERLQYERSKRQNK